MKDTFTSKDYNFVLQLDRDNMIALSFDLEFGEILESTEQILEKLSADLFKKAEEELNVSLEDYGVEPIIYSDVIECDNFSITLRFNYWNKTLEVVEKSGDDYERVGKIESINQEMFKKLRDFSGENLAKYGVSASIIPPITMKL